MIKRKIRTIGLPHMRIAIIGEYTANFPPHAATIAAIAHSATLLKVHVEPRWLSTADIDERVVNSFDGIWLAPGSPYKDMAKMLWLIQQARESMMPCFGTCGGFQHMVIEFARNVLGLQDAHHAEYDPYASKLIISRLACSLVGKQMAISLAAGSRVAAFYGAATSTEEYYCNFAVNPKYIHLLADSGFRIVGSDTEGEAHVMEIPSHPFFVGSLFVPQARSTKDTPHPLVSAFIQSVHQSAIAEQSDARERRSRADL